MRIIAHLRELDESLKDWQRYQNFSLEDLKSVAKRTPCSRSEIRERRPCCYIKSIAHK